MGVKRTGDWDKAEQVLSGERFQRVSRALEQATQKAALLLVREIKKGIVTQAPGGQAFAPLAGSTVEKKKSSKALIDTGFLLNAITHRLMRDQAFIGLLRGSVNKDGEDLVNIGAIMEFGASIRHPSGGTIIIPPRPFLFPAFVEVYQSIIEFYMNSAKEVSLE